MKRKFYFTPTLEILEDRTVPSVTLNSTYTALQFNDTQGWVPPDTIAAAGSDHIVEAVNSTLAIYNKGDGNRVMKQNLDEFFFGTTSTHQLNDPVVSYDEQDHVFFVGVLDFTTDDFWYTRFADSSGAWNTSDRHFVHITEGNNPSNFMTGDYPRLGWNAGAYFVTFNMFHGYFYNHVSLLTIPKNNFAAPTQSDPFGINNTNHYTLAPAVMHGSTSSDPMYFVEEAGYQNGSKIRVVKETGVLTRTPSFQSFDITVAPYTAPPSATQPSAGNPSRSLIETNGSYILNAEWRDNRLVASQTVGASDGLAHARWYMFDTSSDPQLAQQETIGVGSGANSFFPSVAIDLNNNVGMTFIQTSRANNEYMSMYITGATYQKHPAQMTMETPVRAKEGLATYSALDGSPYRAGDYSGITVDPNDGSFWAANEYATSDTNLAANWGTAIAHFSVSAPTQIHDVAVTAINAPTTVTPGTQVTVDVTVANLGDFSETFAVSLTAGGGTVKDPQPQTVTLERGKSIVVPFTWDTTGLNGSYTLTATATSATDENTSNNVKETTVTVSTTTSVTVTSIDPTTLIKGGITHVTIDGSGFQSGAVVSFENGKGPAPIVTGVKLTGDGTLTADVTTTNGFKGGTWDIRVTNPDGSTGVLRDLSFSAVKATRPSPLDWPPSPFEGKEDEHIFPPQVAPNGPVVAHGNFYHSMDNTSTDVLDFMFADLDIVLRKKEGT